MLDPGWVDEKGGVIYMVVIVRSRKVLVCALAFAMVSVVFSNVPIDVSSDGTVILNPGWIDGALSVPDETLDGGEVWAYSTTEGYEARDTEVIGGQYELTVEGDHIYKIYAKAEFSYDDPTLSYRSETTIWLENRETYIEVGETISDLDFTISPGYVDATVTVTGGDISEIQWYAIHGKVPGYKEYQTYKREWGSDVDGSTTFPVMPWTNVDENGDGDYDDWLTGDLSLYVYGRVKIGSIRYYLEEKYIDVTEAETTELSWTLDVTKGTLYGTATVVGETPVRFDLMGHATIGNDEVSLYKHHAGTMSYSVDVEPATWEVYPRYQFMDLDETGAWTSQNWLIMSDVADTVTVGADASVEHDFYIEPGYVSGTIDLWGANTDICQIQVDGILAGTTGIDAWTQSKTEDYELILCEGDWFIGVPDVYMWFDYDTSTSDIDYDFSWLRYRDYYERDYGSPLTVEAGETYNVDYSFGTAMVTLNYQIAGGGKLYAPDIRSYCKDYTVHDKGYVSNFGYGRGSDDLVTEGQATITVLRGKHDLTASAFVEDGSYTEFGTFTIEVEPGDVFIADLDAPDLVVTEPTGLQHFSTPSVTVKGTATDDTGVETVTVNGVEVELTETTPGDASDVSFETTLTGLSYGEHTITVVATDSSGKTTTVIRTVIRDNDPPVIDSFSVSPVVPVKLGDLTTVSATVSDPYDDALTTTIDWGDDTTTTSTDGTISKTHEYSATGVYTITLSVTDGDNTVSAVHKYTVVYDPEGGFVTGGGWIISPEGAYTADETLTGKANFGFVSKYKKGATVPTGNVEFQFKVGDLNFHSKDFDWLVIAGSKAKFKGTGTINGEGSYGFMISAIDGNDDTFRIKIWDKDNDDAVVYDNQLDADEGDDPTTTLGGGNIVVHKPK